MPVIEDYQHFCRTIDATDQELDEAIGECSRRTTAHAHAEEKYHLKLALVMSIVKEKYGATMAETMAKGDAEVAEVKRVKEIAAGKERAAVQRVRKIEANRSLLGIVGAWGKNI